MRRDEEDEKMKKWWEQEGDWGRKAAGAMSGLADGRHQEPIAVILHSQA